jgi:hypothetical protein
MKVYSEDEKTAIRYLLGELAEGERDRFEERLFEDENFSLFLDDVENDLIDEYLRGELDFDAKRRFEAVYLKNEDRLRKLEAARILHKELFEPAPATLVSTVEEKSFLQKARDFFRFPKAVPAFGLAALLLLFLIGGLWISNQREERDMAADNTNRQIFEPSVNAGINENGPAPANRSENADAAETNAAPERKDAERPAPQKTENEKPKSEKPKKEKPETEERKTAAGPRRIFAFSMLPALRSSNNPVLTIPPSAQTVRLRLFDNFGKDYQAFSVELTDATGSPLWSQKVKTGASPKSITVDIPSSVFSEGGHEIAVRGTKKDGNVEEISFYNFIVRRK